MTSPFSPIAIVMIVFVGAVSVSAADFEPRFFDYQVVNIYPHDSKAFSQGLVFVDGQLYEGTGRYRHSTLRQVDLQTGNVQAARKLSWRYFGEGITVWKDRIFQLTWKEECCFVYDRRTLQLLGQMGYDGEGWGLTHDDQSLILSNGSSEIQFLDPETFRITKRIQVTDRGRPVKKLNELEYINGWIYANVWETDFIAIISPETGRVGGWIDLRELLPARQRPHRNAVLNGIAYDEKTQRLFVTGKDWPRLFEIRLIPRKTSRAAG